MAAAVVSGAARRKQDERQMRELRALAALDDNRVCFDCHQRGPTYVNMTVGAFVCTSCSGLLRGLNPAHRVKSISMTSFSAEDVEFILCRGNNLCNKVWMGLFDHRSLSASDSTDETKMRDLMVQKYERRRWYLQPTEEMYAEARRRNTAAATEAKPTRCAVVGPILALSKPPALQMEQLPKQLSSNSDRSASSPSDPMKCESFFKSTDSKKDEKELHSNTFDLLGDLGAELMACSPPTSSGDAGFADFSKFDANDTKQAYPSTMPSLFLPTASCYPDQSMLSAGPPLITQSSFPLGGPPALLTPQTPSSAPPSFPLPSAPFNPLTVPQTSGALTSGAPPASGVPPASGAAPGDKYAALAELDGLLGSASGSSTAIDWDNRFARRSHSGSDVAARNSGGWEIGAGSVTSAWSGGTPAGTGSWSGGTQNGAAWNDMSGTSGGTAQWVQAGSQGGPAMMAHSGTVGQPVLTGFNQFGPVVMPNGQCHSVVGGGAALPAYQYPVGGAWPGGAVQGAWGVGGMVVPAGVRVGSAAAPNAWGGAGPVGCEVAGGYKMAPGYVGGVGSSGDAGGFAAQQSGWGLNSGTQASFHNGSSQSGYDQSRFRNLLQ